MIGYNQAAKLIATLYINGYERVRRTNIFKKTWTRGDLRISKYLDFIELIYTSAPPQNFLDRYDKLAKQQLQIEAEKCRTLGWRTK